MSQLILVLEENPEIQSLIAASFKASAISVTQESNPDLFVQQAKYLEPDLILLSNSDFDLNYKNCRNLRKDPKLKNIPVILLANSKDEISEKIISELGINGFLRKPFEASTLQEQLSKFITLDKNFGIEPDNSGEDFRIDMSSIDNQLNDIKNGKQKAIPTGEEESQVTEELEKKIHESRSSSSAGSEMDSMILDDISMNSLKTEIVALDENEMSSDNLEVINDEGMAMDNGFEFDLKLDEDDIDADSEDVVSDILSTSTDPASVGLAKLKESGLEEKYAENRLNIEDEIIEPDLKASTEINLEVNDFEEEVDILTRSPKLDRIPKEDLTDINLDEEDFQPEFPENLSSFEKLTEPSPQDTDFDSNTTSEFIQEMDNFELETISEESIYEPSNSIDNKLLSDSVEQEIDRTDIEQYVEDTSADEFETDLDQSQEDVEIMSMVQESIGGQEESAESAMIELEDLSEQMKALDSEETELETKEEELEEYLEKDKKEVVGFSEDEQTDSEEEMVTIMSDEIGDLLEIDEKESEDEKIDYGDLLVDELEDSIDVESIEKKDVDSELEKGMYTEESPILEEDVFDSWEDAEEAFMGFEREQEITGKEHSHPETETSSFENFDEKEKFNKADSFSFTENELKEIVTNSVQNALEKSIAASLVELAVSELKTQVIRMDQSRAL